MGGYAGATELWFDNDTQRWTMGLPSDFHFPRLQHTGEEGTGRFVTPSNSARAVIKWMLTASVLHYKYTSSQLPPSENTDISVTGFSQA